MQRLFPYAIKYEARHRKYGLYSWYRITLNNPFTEPAQIDDMIAAYGANRHIMIAEPVCEKVLLEPVYEKIVDSKGAILNLNEIDDPYCPDQWNLNNTGQGEGIPGVDIGIAEEWKISTGDPDMVVAVKDGGTDGLHVDLDRSVWVNEDLNGYDFFSNNCKITLTFTESMWPVS